METELYKVEKTGTYASADGTKSTYLVAGADIPADQARDLGLLDDARAKELKAEAETRAKSAAPENKSR